MQITNSSGRSSFPGKFGNPPGPKRFSPKHNFNSGTSSNSRNLRARGGAENGKNSLLHVPKNSRNVSIRFETITCSRKMESGHQPLSGKPGTRSIEYGNSSDGGFHPWTFPADEYFFRTPRNEKQNSVSRGGFSEA